MNAKLSNQFNAAPQSTSNGNFKPASYWSIVLQESVPPKYFLKRSSDLEYFDKDVPESLSSNSEGSNSWLLEFAAPNCLSIAECSSTQVKFRMDENNECAVIIKGSSIYSNLH